MNLADYLLLIAIALVLVVSLVTVIRRRQRELEQERQSAALLSHMAATVQEIQKELKGEAPEPRVPSRHLELSGQLSKQLFLSFDRSSRAASDYLIFAASRTASAAHVSGGSSLWWEHASRLPNQLSYRSVLGGDDFDDAVVHAAKVGVIDRDQADALIFWAGSTKPAGRRVGAKRSPLLDSFEPSHEAQLHGST